jgi:hypothetical protein
MNAHFPAQRRWASRFAHLTVVIVVLALAAATFVLSYTGVHAIALQAGVPTRLARIYPGIFDAALVIACVTALMLREGRWWARAFAWLSIILVIAVAGAADAVHAMDVALPHRKTAGVVAAAPWVLVLLGFSLWLTMLRQSRTQHADQPLQPTADEAVTLQPAALQPAADEAATLQETTVSEPADEAQGEMNSESQSLPEQATAESETADEPDALPHDYRDTDNAGDTDNADEPNPWPATARRVPATPDEEEPPLPFVTVPRLRRVRSTPTPPEDDEDL